MPGQFDSGDKQIEDLAFDLTLALYGSRPYSTILRDLYLYGLSGYRPPAALYMPSSGS